MTDTAGDGTTDTAAAPGAAGASDAAVSAVADAPGANTADAAKPDRRVLSLVALGAIAGGVAAWLSSGREWTHGVAGHLPNVLAVTAKGGDLSGAVTTLGLTAVAGALVLFATRGVARQILGLLLLAVGAGLAVEAALAPGHAARALADEAAAKGIKGAVAGVSTNSWWVLALVGGTVVAVTGLVTLWKGRNWPGMSSRYEKAARAEAVAKSAAASPKGLWDALDRGEDPTGEDPAGDDAPAEQASGR